MILKQWVFILSRLYILLLLFKFIISVEIRKEDVEILKLNSATRNNSLFWGPYRTNLYFSVRARTPYSLLTGLAWGNLNSHGAIKDLRHACDNNHDIEYEWDYYIPEKGGESPSWIGETTGHSLVKELGLKKALFFIASLPQGEFSDIETLFSGKINLFGTGKYSKNFLIILNEYMSNKYPNSSFDSKNSSLDIHFNHAFANALKDTEWAGSDYIFSDLNNRIKHFASASNIHELPPPWQLYTLWTPFGIKSLSKAHPYYSTDEDYWRGSVWIQMNYLLLSPLHTKYSTSPGPYQKQAQRIYKTLRSHVIHNIFQNWEDTGFTWERYDQSDGHGRGSHPFDGWTGACSLLILSEIYHI